MKLHVTTRIHGRKHLYNASVYGDIYRYICGGLGVVISQLKIPVKTSSFKISTLISPFQLFNQPTCRNSVCFTIFCSLKSLCSPTKDCWPRCFPFFGGGQAMRTCEISTIKTVTKKQQAFRLFYLQGPSDVFFRKDFLQCPRSKKTNDPSHPAQCQKSWQGQLEL